MKPRWFYSKAVFGLNAVAVTLCGPGACLLLLYASVTGDAELGRIGGWALLGILPSSAILYLLEAGMEQ